MSQSLSNNINSLNTIVNNFTINDDRSDILAWLSPLDPKFRHQDIQNRRVENVGEWLLQTEEFKSWRAGGGGDKSDTAVLFCYGDPGAGKTFISSLVIDRLCDQAGGRNVTVACFYFDFAAQNEHSPASILGALLKQLVGGLDETPAEILRAYRDQKSAIGGRGPQLADIVKMLQATTSLKPTFICIDALDECGARYRAQLLDSLDKILRKSPGTRIFVTGRPHIQTEVGNRLRGRVTTIHITPRRHDIICYLHSRLDQDTTPDAMDGNLKVDILKKIAQDISEIFLLVSLNVDAILQETTISSRRRKLNAITDGLGLGGVYCEALSRIKAQGREKSKLGISALMWISHSERPIYTDELCHALGVEIGSSDLDAGNIPSIGTVLSCCQGLASVDKESSTVRLIHFTLQEYLRAYPGLLGTPHSTMAETCLSYLNSNKIKSLPAGRTPSVRGIPFPGYSPCSSLSFLGHSSLQSSAPLLEHSSQYSRTPFLGYSSLYSGASSVEHSSLRSSAPLLQHSPLYSSTPPLGFSQYPGPPSLEYSSRYPCMSPIRYPPPYSCAPSLQSSSQYLGTPFLEYASLYWGIHAKRDLSDCAKRLALKLFDDYSNHISTGILLHAEKPSFSPLNSPPQSPFSGLHSASFFGIVGIVACLVEVQGCDVNQIDWTGSTPLVWAASNGHEEVVRVLLERDNVNPDKASGSRGTPLWYAAKNGHEGVVGILLGRDDVNPDKEAGSGETPLWCAAKNGHEGVVKILLARGDVNPERPDRDWQTPLWWAARNGHDKVVEILLEWGGVDPDVANFSGETPLLWAAKNAHEEVVKILLGQDSVDSDRPNSYGETPLWWAAMNGHEEVVKILLRRGEVNPDRQDSEGRTPLWCAAENGHSGVVKILVVCYKVDPDKPDNLGRTPLRCAAKNGHDAVVETLLRRDDVDPNKLDEDWRTPLWRAASNGHERVVKMLLERGGVNPNKANWSGETPLWCAAKNGHKGVVKILLGRDDVIPADPDRDHRTPLWWAASNGHKEVVEILLGRGGVDPDAPDQDSRTPLWCAAKNGHEGVVGMLLEQGNVNPDKPDIHDQTPLLCAAMNGHEGVVKMLLGRDDVNPNKPDSSGRTPLGEAAMRGHAGVAELLQPKSSTAPSTA